MARSRYSKTEIIDGRAYGTFVLEQTNRIKDPDTFVGIETIEHVVVSGERLDHLAARYMNDGRYWWAIALVNNMLWPYPTAGTKIRIPVDISQVLNRI